MVISQTLRQAGQSAIKDNDPFWNEEIAAIMVENELGCFENVPQGKILIALRAALLLRATENNLHLYRQADYRNNNRDPYSGYTGNNVHCDLYCCYGYHTPYHAWYTPVGHHHGGLYGGGRHHGGGCGGGRGSGELMALLCLLCFDCAVVGCSVSVGVDAMSEAKDTQAGSRMKWLLIITTLTASAYLMYSSGFTELTTDAFSRWLYNSKDEDGERYLSQDSSNGLGAFFAWSIVGISLPIIFSAMCCCCLGRFNTDTRTEEAKALQERGEEIAKENGISLETINAIKDSSLMDYFDRAKEKGSQYANAVMMTVEALDLSNRAKNVYAPPKAMTMV